MNKVLVAVVILSAIASFLLYVAINALVPRYEDYFPSGGICFHKPQEIAGHDIWLKPANGI